MFKEPWMCIIYIFLCMYTLSRGPINLLKIKVTASFGTPTMDMRAARSSKLKLNVTLIFFQRMGTRDPTRVLGVDLRQRACRIQ
jgi:hypothetical protein